LVEQVYRLENSSRLSKTPLVTVFLDLYTATVMVLGTEDSDLTVLEMGKAIFSLFQAISMKVNLSRDLDMDKAP